MLIQGSRWSLGWHWNNRVKKRVMPVAQRKLAVGQPMKSKKKMLWVWMKMLKSHFIGTNASVIFWLLQNIFDCFQKDYWEGDGGSEPIGNSFKRCDESISSNQSWSGENVIFFCLKKLLCRNVFQICFL